MYMMYICSMFLSCFCNCALFVCSSHVEEIKNIIIIIIFIIIIVIIIITIIIIILLRSSAMMVLFDVF